MIENLSILSDGVTWTYKGNNYFFKIEDVFYAVENKEMKLIQVESGENFIATKNNYYSYDGHLELHYDLKINTVYWYYQGIQKSLQINYLKQAIYIPQKQRIIVLVNANKQAVYVYNLEGDCVFKINPPIGFEILYFTWIGEQLSIVCEGNKNYEDQYGRSRYNYLLDMNNGKLSKGSLVW